MQAGASRLRTATAEGAGWDAALAAYQAVRPEHCRRVVLTARTWGELWHLDGTKGQQRNAIERRLSGEPLLPSATSRL